MGAGFALGQSVVFFALVWCIIAIAYVLFLRVQTPTLFQKQSYALPEVEEV